MTYARFEKNGQIAFADGERVKKVPSEAACRERLVKLLESVHGDAQHADVAAFWKERARAITSVDELESAWATETFFLLEKIWDQLTSPSEIEPDAFTSFGI